MPIRNTIFPVLGACLWLAACDVPPEYRSSAEQLGFRIDALNGHIVRGPADVVDVAVGTRVCPTFDGWFDEGGATYRIRSSEPDDAWLRGCFELDAGSGAHLEQDCVVVDAAGDTSLLLEPVACALTDDGEPSFAADRLAITAHAIGDLVLTYDDPAVRVIWDELHPGPVAAFGPRPERTADEPLQVLAGAAFVIHPQPVVAGQSRTVAFSDGVASADGDAVAVEVSSNDDGSATFALAADQRFRLALALPAGPLVGDEIVGVAADAPQALEVVVGYQRCAACDDGYGAPSFALAIVRDAAGARVLGTPVTWSLEGDGARLNSDAALADVAAFDEPCTADDVGARREWTLRASLGSLAAQSAVSFVCPDPEQLDERWSVEVIDGEGDDGLACACDARGTSAPPVALLLLVLGVGRRRRGGDQRGLARLGGGAKPSIIRS